MIGLAPKGKFIEYLKSAYIWKTIDKDKKFQSVSMVIGARKPGSDASGFSNTAEIYKGSLSFNTAIENAFPLVTQVSLGGMKRSILMKEIRQDSNDELRWTMPDVSITF